MRSPFLSTSALLTGCEIMYTHREKGAVASTRRDTTFLSSFPGFFRRDETHAIRIVRAVINQSQYCKILGADPVNPSRNFFFKQIPFDVCNYGDDYLCTFPNKSYTISTVPLVVGTNEIPISSTRRKK